MRRNIKASVSVMALAMGVAVLLSWRMSRRGQPQKSLKLFSVGLWLLLVGLIYGGLPPVAAGAAVAMAMMLAVVVSVRSGMVFGVSYLLAWLLYIGLQALCFIVRFRGGKWKSMRVIEPEVIEPSENEAA